MFLELGHTKLIVYQVSEQFVVESYRVTNLFPNHEKFAMIQQIRRAALSVHLNIAEGCSRRSNTERARYFEIARGSVIEVDSAIGIAHKLEYATSEDLNPLGQLIIRIYKLLTGLIKSNNQPTHH